MKLHEYTFRPDHRQYGDQVPRDLQRIYGGGVEKGRNGGQRVQRFESPDQLVEARVWSNKPNETIGRFNDVPVTPRGAAYRTALLAYEQRSGVTGQTLAVEIPGQRAYQEWMGRRTQAQAQLQAKIHGEYEATTDALVEDTSLSSFDYTRRTGTAERRRDRALAAVTAAFDISTSDFWGYVGHAAGESPAERWFQQLGDNIIQAGNGASDFIEGLGSGDTGRAAAGFKAFHGARAAGEGLGVAILPEESPDHTIFYAQGELLPDAAVTMAKNYGELTFHADHPGRAVADCLGATSMTLERFGNVWADAMVQPTPVAAGQLVLRALL